MTTGQLVFYAGIGLLGATVLLAVIFLIVRPKYKPENAVYTGGRTDGSTQRLRNGYPTERVTVRRDGPAKAENGLSGPQTEKTEILNEETDVLSDDHTTPLL